MTAEQKNSSEISGETSASVHLIRSHKNKYTEIVLINFLGFSEIIILMM